MWWSIILELCNYEVLNYEYCVESTNHACLYVIFGVGTKYTYRSHKLDLNYTKDAYRFLMSLEQFCVVVYIRMFEASLKIRRYGYLNFTFIRKKSKILHSHTSGKWNASYDLIKSYNWSFSDRSDTARTDGIMS